MKGNRFSIFDSMEEIPEDLMEHVQEQRRLLRQYYTALYDDVSSILFRHDPMGINFETNTDEYEPEVGTILPRLKEANSEDDLTRIIHQEFIRWFNGDNLVGEPAKYKLISGDIWRAYQKFMQNDV